MKIKVKKEQKIYELLLEEFKTATRSMIKKAMLHGSVTLNGKEISNSSVVVKPGDEVEYNRYHAPKENYNAPFHVLYEDDDLLVVDKPAGVLTHAERGSTGTSVYKEMLEYIRERSKGKERIYVVHRLDREVSGIVLFAKSESIQELIKDNWRETTKKYYALVNGSPREPEGRLQNWLREGREQRVFVVREQEDAKLAVLHYKVVKPVKEMTLLDVQLETGRKNQIRVQLANIGCPVVGDWRYGSKEKVKRRIRLHAYYFRIIHPVSGKEMEFTSRMPRGFLSPSDHPEKY